ncbi:hypothetical protein [Cellulomonas sp. PS-H5]|uniref:hypothetical protein n=1 Tax=Cellulomonas sp. PS-H5 TaxID=2820400 RepID=UPI001C4F1078|nr:hypothetical protein [Cellulomonas sp. PS-H5]MBW0252602.1 hypothetical protein [Cellulomonas sp. PS-H5]
MAQFDLLRWVADGCLDGVYDGTSHRVSARALHNRSLIRIEGRGATWTAAVTPEGVRRLQDEAKRVEAERERLRREERARAEQERAAQQLRERAVEVLERVVAAGGRLELGSDVDEREMTRIEGVLLREHLVPAGERLTHEPTRMDPSLGVTAYLEPDFAARTPVRAFTVPRQLRGPHPAIVAFQEKRALVSKTQIPRAARFLQGLADAAVSMGWKVSAKVPNMSTGRDEVRPDLSLRVPSRELIVTMRELDQRGRQVSAFTTTPDYYPRTSRTSANKQFLATGRLEVTVEKAWEQQAVLTLRDTSGATLEEQLPTFIRQLEIAEAEAVWARQEGERRAEIRQVRWEEVKREAFTKLSYERNAARLRDELARREAAAAMREYAGEVDAQAASLGPDSAQVAREWAVWIREHAERTDPIHGALHVVKVTACSHEEIAPHMNGWSAYGPHRG